MSLPVLAEFLASYHEDDAADTGGHFDYSLLGPFDA